MNIETITSENVLLIGSILLFISILVGKAGSSFGVPILLLFLGVGMMFGSDGLGIEFNNAYKAQFIGSAALSVILFSGGMDTRIKEIRPVVRQGIILSTLGVMMTTLITGLIIFYSSKLTPFTILTIPESMLLAATMSSTDSASVFSILRSKGLKLRQNLRPLLELESGSNDPMAFMLTSIFIKMVMTGEMSIQVFLSSLIIQFVIGAICGWGIASILLFFISKRNFDGNSVYHILLLAALFFIFSFTDSIGGNGFLAVYIAGLTIGNSKVNCDKSTFSFFESIAWLSQLIMFLTLGLLVNPKELLSPEVAGMGMIVAFSMIIVSRPMSVYLCLIPFRKMSMKMKGYISWVGLRGAVPIVFAIYLLLANVNNALLMFNIVFFVTIISLLTQGTTVGFSAKKLGLTEEGEL